ncbi:MAG: hypothetical protein QOE42_909 [Chloroflexota bacterium]|nr:hypothetical protein [Chloroflexota bacterium]
MARAPKPPVDPDDAPLKRLGGGRWQTRDERFTIEPQSGTWVVVDAEQTDELGMALVRGPFPSLTAAKDAIATARTTAAATSPLADRIERRRSEPAPDPGPRRPARGRPQGDRAKPSPPDATNRPEPRTARADAAPGRAARDGRAAAPGRDEGREPAWLADLEAGERGRARRLIERLREDGVPDAEGLVRRDVVGNVPALAGAVIGRRLAALDAGTTPQDVAELLADGRDERLGVRWRLVDGDGRPIVLDRASRRKR